MDSQVSQKHKNGFTSIEIPFGSSGLVVEIFEESRSNSLFLITTAEADLYGESPYQIKEDCTYQYCISQGYYLEPIARVVQPFISNTRFGRIIPGNYVGLLAIGIFNDETDELIDHVRLEVQSTKTSYRDDYRHMLEELTNKCTSLLMSADSPASQSFMPSFNDDHSILYQRFAFIKSVISSEEFEDAIHKFLTAPTAGWRDIEVDLDARSIRRFRQKELKQFLSANNRILSSGKRSSNVTSFPRRIKSILKDETLDTPENRFIKFALMSFLTLVTEIKSKSKVKRLFAESELLAKRLEQILSHGIFKEILLPDTLPLNSPVLQKKEGYREILRAWLMFDLASKLVWQGGEDVYSANKKDVAVLYEYWLFFKLLELINEVFDLNYQPTSELIEPSSDGLNLKLKQGKYLPIKGVCRSFPRALHVEFSYNRIFEGGKKYPKGGSWSTRLRPDYTLSVWPFGIDQLQAEEEEIIVHIHFDAKYRLEEIDEILNGSTSTSEDRKARSDVKTSDLLKMHTYRDAIRRTAGAYVIYPGVESGWWRGFHELLPGLGAFGIRPSKTNTGTEDLRLFLQDVLSNFLNRASQREKMSFKTFDTHKHEPDAQLKYTLPEFTGSSRIIPDETHVLVGAYKNREHLEWILNNKLYNARTGVRKGSLNLHTSIVGAKYLALHGKGKNRFVKMFKLNDDGPRLFSKDDLNSRGYPNPRGSLYLVYEIVADVTEKFEFSDFDVRKLFGYEGRTFIAEPFAVTLTELIQTAI